MDRIEMNQYMGIEELNQDLLITEIKSHPLKIIRHEIGVIVVREEMGFIILNRFN